MRSALTLHISSEIKSTVGPHLVSGQSEKWFAVRKAYTLAMEKVLTGRENIREVLDANLEMDKQIFPTFQPKAYRSTEKSKCFKNQTYFKSSVQKLHYPNMNH